MELPEGSMLLIENHCPITSAAKSCNLLCRSELEVFKTLLGPAVSVERVEHLMQGDRRCAYRVIG
jgi:predicted ArsR family transcriptional regulator